MKRILPFFFLILLISSKIFSQEGTKQLMPNEGDRLYLEMFVSGNDFATYGADEKDRLHIYLEEGEKMHFGMQMYTDDNYGGNCETDEEDVWFRIKDPDGVTVYDETNMFTSGNAGFINNYSEAVTGPNGVILNGTEITNGYNSATLTANKTGNYYIEFYSNDEDVDAGWYTNYRRFALKYFDVTVTKNDTVITNPGEPNVSAGRLWSKNWSLTSTSWTEYPVKVYFHVFTSDEFVNKIQYKMKPFSFNFASNPFGIENDASLNVIEKAQSQDGNQSDSDQIPEYKIYLNDPDRSVWKTTALPPPKVKVWHEDQLIYDYDYMREPMQKEIEPDTLILEKNEPGCEYSSLTLFKIKTNIDGFATILLDIDGNGYSTDGNDRVLHRKLKKGNNYILWNFRNDDGNKVSNGPVSISATFFGRGPTHFPLFDVETLSEVTTKTKRPFNKLCPTLYWDDRQISDWGDDAGTGSMDETDTSQLVYGNTETPRVLAFNIDRDTEAHNGNMNTINSWYNAIDLGRTNIMSEVITGDTCIDGSRPILGDVHVDTTKNDLLHFESEDFTGKFSDPYGKDMQNIRIETLPDNGELLLNGSSVTAGQTINTSDLDNLSFTPDTDWTGTTTFLWNASNGDDYAVEEDTVNIFINTPPDISNIQDTTICTDETLEIEFTVNDEDDIHDPEDIEVIAYSNNLEVIPNQGCEVEGEGETRSLTIEPYGIKSGYIIIYLQAYDGVTSIIEEFAIKLSPSLDFTGDTSVCAGSQLELTAEEVGADSYIWEREGEVVGTERTYTDNELYEEETGTYTLTVEKGECISSRDFNVSIYPIVSFSGDTDVCVGETLELSADENVAEEYTWEKGGYEVGSSKVLTLEDVDMEDAGDDYTLYVRKEGCENISDPFSVSVKYPPEQDIQVTGDTVDTGENATVTIFDSENDILYRAFKDDEEVASGTGTGNHIELNISSEYLEIGENTITFTADNGNCEVDLYYAATVYVNSYPQAVVDSVTIDENTNITHNVLSNDSGLDDGGLTLEVSSGPYYGEATTDNQDSTITYEPQQDYFGQDSLVYTVCDIDDDCDSAYMFINIEYVDNEPTAEDDYITMDEDTDTIIDVLANDYDLDSGLTVTVTSPSGNGNAEVNDDNTVYYEPDPDFYGSDEFTYRVEDAEGDADEATVYITVENIDDQPVANDDIATTNEDESVEIYILDNDDGLGDGVADVKIINSPTNGTATVDTYNDEFPVTYEPNPDYNGDDWFEYEVIDEDGDSDEARVDVSINPTDDPVTANDDYVSLDEDTNIDIDVIDNDEVPDGVKELNIETEPGNGEVNILSNNEINYQPDPDYYGEDSFVYEVIDDHGDDNDFATVHITVDSLPDNVVASNDEVALDEDTETNIAVLENDDVPDGVKEINITTEPSNGAVTILSNNEINYEPNEDYNGDDNFVYEVTDNFDDTDDATVSITVEPVDDGVTANDDDVTIDEDTSVDIPVTENDDIPDGVESLTIVNEPGNGYAEVNDDNTIYYEPDPDYNGEDSFVYEVVDAQGADTDQATVNITIEWVNDIPQANDDNTSTTQANPVTVNVLRNDGGLGDGVDDLSIYSDPENGTASASTEDSTITYEPGDEFSGIDTLTYMVCDSLDSGGNYPGECDRAELIISVGDTNYIPIANDDNVEIDEDNDTTINILDNDENLYDGVDYVEIIEGPDNGFTDVNNDNTVNYSPYEDYNGADSFDYAIFDNDGDSDTATVQIDIVPVNDIPDAVDDYITMDEDTNTTVNVLENDNGLGDGIDNLEIATEPQNGTAEVTGDSTIKYEPETDFYGEDEFEYTVTDADGEASTATVHITVENVNDIPEAIDDNVTMDEDSDTTVNVLENDNGLGDGIDNLEIETEPQNGTAEVTGDSTIKYEPRKDFYGEDELEYKVTDADGEASTATVHITVENVNDIPEAVNDTVTMDEDTDTTVNVLENDNGLGDGIDNLEIETEPQNGTAEVTGDSTIKYEPETDFYGEDELEYTVTDADGESSTATVHITVENVNDIPDAVDDNITMDEDTDTTVNVLENDNGLGDGIDYLEIETAAENGNTEVAGDSTINYEPDTDFYGEDEFEYTVTDVDGESSTATVHITVENVNDIPDAIDDNITMDEDTDTTVNVLENDNGLGDGIDYLEIETAAENGNAEVAGDSAINYEPDTDFYGEDEFEYTVTDVDGESSTATVHITVENVNDIPDAVDDTVETDEDVPVTFNVLENDNGLGDGGLNITITQTPENGEAEIAGDSTITYSPELDYYGEDTLTYEVSDTDNETSTAKVFITVEPVDDHKPEANDDEVGTNVNTPVEIDVLFNDTGLEDGGIRVFIDNANSPENGTIQEITDDNTIVYEPGTDFTGSDDFDYEVYDLDDDVSTATVTVNVVEDNHVPVANDDNAYTYKNTPVKVDVLANDENLDDGGIRVSEWIEPNHGEVISIDSNYVQYMPEDGYSGNDRFTYLVEDAEGDYDTASVYMEIKDEENIIPIAHSDTAITDENTDVTYDVLQNDESLDDGVYTLTVIETPENGEVTSIEVSGSYGNEEGNITYNPDTDYYGADSLSYEVCDHNEDCDSAKMFIEINPVDNHTPVAVDDSCGTNINTDVEVHVLMNDYGLGDGGIKISEHIAPSNGVITGIDNDKGTMNYNPGNDYLGYDYFDYQVSDYDGDTDEANVKITVRENNLVPVANPDKATTPKETPVEIDVLENDIAGDESMADMKVTEFISPENGSISISEDFLVTYTPNADFNVGIDTFWYKVDDIDGDWDTTNVTISVYDGYNHQPHAFDDYIGFDEDAHPVFIHVLENDTALQDKPISLSVERDPLHGEVTEIQGDSAIYYKPDADYFGKDSLVYKVNDINGDSDTARVFMDIYPVDDGYPNARDDSTGTTKNTPVNIDVLMNDDNLEDSIEIYKLSDPSNGTIKINEDSTITYTPDTDFLGRDEFEYQICDYDDQCDEAKVVVQVRKDNFEPTAYPDSANTLMNQSVKIHVLNNDTGLDDGVGKVTLWDKPENGKTRVRTDNTIDYEPDEDYAGDDRFVYKVDDIDGDWDTAKVTVNIDTVPNYIPVAKDDYRATQMDEPVEVDVLANDSAIHDEPLNVWIMDEPQNGEARVLQETNNVLYEPNEGYLGTDTLQYAVFDNDDDSDTANVIITVKEENLIPVAINDSAHTLMNHEVEVHVLNNDSLLQDGLDGIEIYSQADHGELEITRHNTIIYNPYKWYTGSDEFEYLVKDNDGDSDIATVFVTVEEIPNYVPNARDDSTGTSMNEEVTIDVLRNDEGLNDTPISLSAISEPDNGEILVNEDNTITYKPADDFLGYDYFEYKVCDYDDECDEAEVKVNVRENNTVPVALDDKVYTRINTPVNVEVLENDYGLEDGFGNLTIAKTPSYGTVEIESDYSVTYSPNQWYMGSDTLVYELTDIDGDFDTASVIVGVKDGNDPLPDVYLSEISGNTSENKTKAFFNMALTKQPDEEVYIPMHSTDTTEGTLSVDTIRFTSANWDREQTVTITGVDDNIVDGDIEYSIKTDNAVSSDITYDGLTVSNVELVNYDNDKPGLNTRLASETNKTSEDGDSVKIAVTLDTEPTREIQIDAFSTDPGEGVVENNKIIFYPYDGELKKEFIVIGVDDDERDGDIEYEIEFNLTTEDTCYSDTEIENFSLVNEDNDEIKQFIPDAFSPDNDGLNERFQILGLEDYNNLSIKIYNRWGTMVYSNSDYKNNWDGRANVSTLGSKKLPSGTYYYHLKIKDTGETIEGSVFLKR